MSKKSQARSGKSRRMTQRNSHPTGFTSLRRQPTRANYEALERQKRFPELVCLKPIRVNDQEVVSETEKVTVTLTQLRDPVSNELLYAVSGAKNGALYLTRSELVEHFDTSVVTRWEDSPMARTNFNFDKDVIINETTVVNPELTGSINSNNNGSDSTSLKETVTHE